MCINNHYIYNKYIHKRVLVPCGKCKECLQAKADARAERIRHSFSAGEIGLFVTLTYDNNHVPYVFKKDIQERSNVTVYRGLTDSDRFSIGSLYVDDLPYNYNSSLLPNLRNSSCKDKVGICYYKDIQNFFKRLRINFLRKYGYPASFKYYAATEYGETYYRPHAHILLIIPCELEKAYREIIYQSWKMCDFNRLHRSIEVARNAAAYLSSYINSDSSLPLLFKSPSFRQKHSYSHGFGCNSSAFSLQNIISCVERNSMSYDVQDSRSESGYSTFLIPKYIISRYFPIFKGYSRTPPCEMLNVLQRPAKLAALVGNSSEWSNEDIRTLGIMLRNKAILYYKTLNIPLPDLYDDYAIMYEKVWRCYNSTRLRLFYHNMMSNLISDNIPILENYDNINELHLGVVHSDLSDINDIECYVNYNALPSRVKLHNERVKRYDVMFKRKKITNQVMQTWCDDI